jgi:Transcriptional regulators
MNASPRPSVQISAAQTHRQAATAPYNRVKQHLKLRLSQGLWEPGTLMPSEAELVAQFGVSRMTVNRALRELQAEGLVERVQGVGTFAAQLHHLSSSLTIRDMREHVESRGHHYRLDVRYVREDRVPADVAARLGLAAGAMAFHSLVIHHDDDVPLQCEDRWVNPASAPNYMSADFTQTTPTQYLLEVAPTVGSQLHHPGERAHPAGGALAQDRFHGTLPHHHPLDGQSWRAGHAGQAGSPRFPLLA